MCKHNILIVCIGHLCITIKLSNIKTSIPFLMLLFYLFLKYEFVETMNVIVGKVPKDPCCRKLCFWLPYHVSCRMSAVVKGVGNTMFIEQGFPLLLCTRQGTELGRAHPRGRDKICRS